MAISYDIFNPGEEMEEEIEDVKQITIKNNVIVYNDHHELGYFTKPGIIEIEFVNGRKIILDVEAGCDITSCDFFRIFEMKKTREHIIFSNLRFTKYNQQ